MKIGTGIYLEKLKENPDFYQETYDCLEIQDFVMPNNLDENLDKVIGEYRTILKNYQGSLSIHGPYIDLNPTSFDPLVREVCTKRYRQALTAATALGAAFMVVHSNYEVKEYDAGYDPYFLEQSILFWKDLIKAFESAQVTAVMENIHNKDAYLIKEIIDAVNSPYLAACLDTGHAHALAKSPLSPWVTTYMQRLQYIHLHDNDGEVDQHLPLGEGTIQFTDFFKKLREIQFDAIVICEIFGDIASQEENLRQLKYFLAL